MPPDRLRSAEPAMTQLLRASRTLVIAVVVLFLAAAAAAQEIRVMTSGGFTAPFLEVVPEFERSSKRDVVTSFGASMGGAPDSIPSRLSRGEPADVLILAAEALDALV